MLRVVPCTITEAREFVRRVHRHHPPPVSALFAVAVADDNRIVGVATAGRPVARMLDDGWTYEVTRVGTDGARNGCSMLYGAVRRAGRALGYLRGVTYTLPEEGGASLRASGWTLEGEARGGAWGRKSRPRTVKAPTSVKSRWTVIEVGWEQRGARPRVLDEAQSDQLSLIEP